MNNDKTDFVIIGDPALVNSRPPRSCSGAAGMSPAVPSEKFARSVALGNAVIRPA